MPHPTASDYARAEQLLAPYRSRLVPGRSLAPQWVSGGARFSYEIGGRHVLVDPSAGTRRPAFDHDRLAAALSQAAGRAVVAAALPISQVGVREDGGGGDVVRFTAFGSRWEWSDRSGALTGIDDPQPAPHESASPDGRWVAFRRDGDVHVRSRDGGESFALTDDAEPEHEYGRLPDALYPRTLLRAFGIEHQMVVTWSPDSTRLLVHRLDQRDLPEQVLVESSPAGGGRPVEHRYRYPMPGEEAQATMTWSVLDVEARTVVTQQDEPTVVMHPADVMSPRWSGDDVYLLDRSRDARTLELNRFDAATGKRETLIEESGDTRVDTGPVLGDPPLVRVLVSGEVLWWSQRDGWGHLHLYSADGRSSTQVTRGQWLVRAILRVDEDARRVWFLAGGLGDGDPYRRQICCVDLDGTGFTRLTDDEFDHNAVCPPEGAYILDRASTPALPPRSRVLGLDGQVLVELEAPSTAALEELGWAPPERFCVPAADGVTPVWGLLWRPHGLDPAQRYPIIEHIYPGPPVHRAGPAFDVLHTGEPEAYAALGFAVVAIDGRGTAGRSKAFLDHSYRAMDQAGMLDDHVAAIRRLGHRYPWLDTGRVGITGHSAGGYAAARALLTHAETYSVAVAVSGNHDPGHNTGMWAEQYHGDVGDEGKRAISNPVAAAAGLTGKLLLIHGELDDNTSVYQTLRLVDALLETDADVDMLVVPGADHAILLRRHVLYRRTWDYFVRHLHGTEPPRYRLAPLPLF